jgi:uncharacterized membrane protein
MPAFDQATIPVSMIVYKCMIKTQYKFYHYIGAALVLGGLAVSLKPQFSNTSDSDGKNQLLWAAVLIVSCIPMAFGCVCVCVCVWKFSLLLFLFVLPLVCSNFLSRSCSFTLHLNLFSAVYKEMALGKNDMNGMYLNGNVAIFQLFFSLLLSIPSVYAQPGLDMSHLFSNFASGFKCLAGKFNQMVR